MLPGEVLYLGIDCSFPYAGKDRETVVATEQYHRYTFIFLTTE